MLTTNLQHVTQALLAGDIVAIPTETVYGLAAVSDNDAAVKKIYALKQRPTHHPLIMHISPDWDIEQWATDIPDHARTLIKHFWPGPLTLVLKAKPKRVNPLINGGQDTVAIRCPDHPLTQQLLSAVGQPLVAPSANPFGKISPTTAQHVKDSFQDESLLIFDGGRCGLGIESTIVAAVDEHHLHILRHGTLDEATLQKVVPAFSHIADNNLRAPGRLKTHYQPEKPLFCFDDIKKLRDFCETSEKKAYVLAFDSVMNTLTHYRFQASPASAAYELYYQLRLADASDAAILVMQLPPDTIAWQGFRERALKAGQYVDKKR